MARFLTLLLMFALPISVRAAPSEAALGPHIIGLSRALTFVWTEQAYGSDPKSGSTTSGGGLVSIGNSVLDVPRLGYDHRFFGWLTVGTDLAIGGTTRRSGWGDGQMQTTDTFTLGVTPRVGAILPLSDRIALWPQAGFSFLYSKSTTTGGPLVVNVASIANVWSGPGGASLTMPVNFNLLLVITPLPHFGVTIGGSFDSVFTPGSWTLVQGWHVAMYGGVLTYW